MVRLKIIQKVNGAGRFENANFFYRFVGNYRQAEALHESDIKRLGFGHSDLSQVVARMYEDPALVTRSYTNLSVVGSQAVQFFLAQTLVTNTRDAVILGNLLIKDALLVAGQYKYNPNVAHAQQHALQQQQQQPQQKDNGYGNGNGNGAAGGMAGSAPGSPATGVASVITGYPFRNAELVYYITGPLLDQHIQNERKRELALQKAEQLAAAAQKAAAEAALSGNTTPSGPLTPHLATGQQPVKPGDATGMSGSASGASGSLGATGLSGTSSPTPGQMMSTTTSSLASSNSSSSGGGHGHGNGHGVPGLPVHHLKHNSNSSSLPTPHSMSAGSSAAGAGAYHNGSPSLPSSAGPAVAGNPLGAAAASSHGPHAADGTGSVFKPHDSSNSLLPKHPHPPTGAGLVPGGGSSAPSPLAGAKDKSPSAPPSFSPSSGANAAADINIPVQFEWEFVQSFGDDSSAYDFDDAEDLVTAVEFDHSGEYLAIGDKAGRISIVQETTQRQKNMPLEYKFYTEFQSHEPEFDALKSVETEPKINVIKWLKHHTHSMHLLTCNDKTVKLWRVGEKRARNTLTADGRRRASSLTYGLNGSGLSADHKGDFSPVEDEPAAPATVVRTVHKCTYKNAHGYNIHSLSVNCDGETFFSADDLRINMWALGRNDECMTIVDVKPDHVTDIDELITSAAFHPTHCHLLMYGSSKGAVRLGDMRQRALVDRHTTHFENKTAARKTYFSEITNSILDAKFSANGRFIIARDYMTVRLWDVHMPSKPLSVHQVHPQFNTQSQLSILLDNECIFDQFQCALSHDGLHFVTGSYSNCFLVQNTLTKTGVTIEARDDVREPRICAVQSQPIIAAHESKSRLSGAAGQQQQAAAQAAAAAAAAAGGSAVIGPDGSVSVSASPHAALGGVQTMKSKAAAVAAAQAIKMPAVNHKIEAVQYRNKVLRVAWHPRLNAVAVAGLYKLYLYQTKPTANSTPTTAT